MILTHIDRVVAQFSQVKGENFDIFRKVNMQVLGACSMRVHPAEKRGPARTATARGDKSRGEPYAFGSHPVQVYSPDRGVAVAAQVAIAQVISYKPDDIGEFVPGACHCLPQNQMLFSDIYLAFGENLT